MNDLHTFLLQGMVMLMVVNVAVISLLFSTFDALFYCQQFLIQAMTIMIVGGYLKPVPLYKDVGNPYSTLYDHIEEIEYKKVNRIRTTTIYFHLTVTLIKSFTDHQPKFY